MQVVRPDPDPRQYRIHNYVENMDPDPLVGTVVVNDFIVQQSALKTRCEHILDPYMHYSYNVTILYRISLSELRIFFY